jgi:GNAT superfamily N-acetyltransferase
MIVRFIRPGEEDECNAFHNRHHGHRRTPAQWRWEFTPTLFPHPRLPFAVGIDDGRIVATQALIPIRMVDGTGVYWTGKSEETLVEPSHRGQDLSVKMYRLVFEYAEQNGLAFIWGFTTATKPLSRAGFTVPSVTSHIFFPFSTRSVPILLSHAMAPESKSRTGKKAVELLGYLGCAAAQSLSQIRLAASRGSHRTGPRGFAVETRPLNSAPDEAGAISKRFVALWGGATIYRDRDYLNWRIFENPWVKSLVRGVYVNGRLQGWVAFGVGDDGMGYLVDIVVAPDEPEARLPEFITHTLLAEAVSSTRAMGAAGIRGWHVNNHPFDRLVAKTATKMGFYHVGRGMSMVAYLSSHGHLRQASQPVDNWFVTRLWTEGLMG